MDAAVLKVQLSNRQKILAASPRRIREVLRLAAPPEWDGAELSVALVDGERMKALNLQYAGRPEDTDVLAFPLADPADNVIGEIVVSASRAVREAEARGIAPADELALYLVHGALHLQGYDDRAARDRRRMYAREAEVLERAGIGNVRRRPRRRRMKDEEAATSSLHRSIPRV